MPCHNAIRSKHAARPIPAPHRLSQALSNEVRSHEPSEPAFDQTLLDRLDAIFQSIKSTPDLDQAIRLPAVLDLVGVSKSTWYALLNPRSKTFDSRAPQPFKLGPSPNSPSVWWRSAVMAYLRACASPQAWA
ncbi:helix-turn-helix transcriptional regulator [Xanthomonas sacchari]|uniref:helix-turn-helix transcriptional regulator n=1 Tax=Xanthomonas sacchari TaxID=56458 RepID=UPI002255F656|nr:AlpA family phage regulatory protein [Xanthomonas sacchari]